MADMGFGQFSCPDFRALILLLSLLEGVAVPVAQLPYPTPQSEGGPSSAGLDPHEIVRRAVEADRQNLRLIRNYTYQERTVERMLDRNGKPKKQESRTYDISILYGEPFRRLVEKNDRELDGKEKKREEKRIDDFVESHKNETAEQRAARLAASDKKREEKRAFAREVVDAYYFRLHGEERVGGREVYVIEATPRPDFRPKQSRAELLSKFRGTFWIDKQEYQWVKMEAEAIDTISFGFILLRVNKGAKVRFEQTRVNNEIWLPQQISITASGRLGLVVSAAFERETVFSNYRKFVTDSRLLPGVQETQQK